jgi:hypothetical protein
VGLVFFQVALDLFAEVVADFDRVCNGGLWRLPPVERRAAGD